ncbi:MAG: DUF5615 family PIN-like protein [Fimbriimonadaceae bacterium]
MRIVLDAHFSPAIASWITAREEFDAVAIALRDIGLRDASDKEIFHRLSNPSDVVMSKDVDFFELVGQLSAPPKVIWLRCGNRCNDDLKVVLLNTLPKAIDRLLNGDSVVEIKL